MKLGLWLAGGELRAHPWRQVAALAAIAIGVALGLAVHLINASAVAEFSQAVRATTGQADLEIRGPRLGFDDGVLERVAADPAIALASPMLEVDAPILDAPALAKVSRGDAPPGAAAREARVSLRRNSANARAMFSRPVSNLRQNSGCKRRWP